MIEIIGAPWDGCGFRLGSRLGPTAVRLASLCSVLASLGEDCVDHGDIESLPEATLEGGIRNFEPALQTYLQCKSQVQRALANGSSVIVLGGDHSNSIGSIAGALQVYGKDLAVLWIDAHMDLNTPATSPSGNLHGMSLGALTHRPFQVNPVTSGALREGVADRQWNQLLDEVVGYPPLAGSSTGWFAVRDVDRGEQEAFAELDGAYMATMYDVDRYGIVEMIGRMDSWLRRIGARKLWISFDVDCLDPFLAPGTGTAVRGGLSYREMHLIGEMLHECLTHPNASYSLAGVDVVEVNPIVDTNNATAIIAVEWIASLFGKRILGNFGGSH